jgi:type I restriction enzyme M protein
VDTFEEEERVDLGAVVTELRQVESEMGAIDETIRGFCAELGIEVPV